MENGKHPIHPLLQLPIMDQEGKHYLCLTKREYFAGKAMQGLLHNYVANGQYGNHENYPNVSQIAVRCADELLKQLESK